MARQNRRNIARNSAEKGIATAATLQNAMPQHPTEAAADTVGQLRQQLEDVIADRDKLAAERDALRDQLDAEKAAHKEEADQLRERFMKLSEEYADKFAKFTENAQQIADQAQRLQAAQLQKEEPKPIETAATPEEITPQDKPPTFWQRIFGKK